MATKPSKNETKVTRIKASDTPAPKSKLAKKVAEVKAKKAKSAEKPEKTKRKNPFKAILGYFTGAWYELRQVRWPDRKNTWSMTGALLAFTGFFVVLILALDALFKYLFQLLLK